MPSLPPAFLEDIAEERGLTEFEKEVFFARLSDMYKPDIVLVQEISLSRQRYSSRMTGVYAKFGITGSGPNKSHILFMRLLDIYQQKYPKTHNNVTKKALSFVLNSVKEHLAPVIQDRCGLMRVLDMSKPMKISDIYTEVKILRRVGSSRYMKLAEFLDTFNFNLQDHPSIGLSYTEKDRVSGIDYVKKEKKILILGGPGSGKTTFLKHIAIYCAQDKILPNHIPFFISLQYFSEESSQVSLLSYIFQEYQHDNVTQEEIENLLKNGKVICLFDGLDEVSEESENYILRELRDFTHTYSKNRFIITCRLAAQDYKFDNFSEIEIADFNDQQIKQFVDNWFLSDEVGEEEYVDHKDRRKARDKAKDKAKARKFINKIEHESRIRELSTNPLLLTLLCLVFKDLGEFPLTRSELYEEGLSVLLKKWDATRNIERGQPYRKLSRQRKEDMLNQIAYSTFNNNQYFFKRKDIENRIRNYITNLIDASNNSEILDLDSSAILDSIEAHHGLLVERAKGIYSFSHLTFHEYFTARKIVNSFDPESNEEVISELIKRVSEPRWREVILLTSMMFSNSDYFFKKMSSYISGMLNGSKLDNFIDWSKAFFKLIRSDEEQKTYGYVKKTAYVRMFYLYLSCIELGLPSVDTGNNFQLGADRDLILSLKLTNAILSDIEQSKSLTNVYPSKGVSSNLIESCSILRQTLEKALEHISDMNFVGLLREHIQMLPSSEDTVYAWWIDHGISWSDYLRSLLINHKDIGHNWVFSLEQAIRIKQYYEANRLLYDCLTAECYVSQDVRRSILENFLLPSKDTSPTQLNV